MRFKFYVYVESFTILSQFTALTKDGFFSFTSLIFKDAFTII